MIPLFLGAVLVFYILNFLGGLGITTGFASTFIGQLKGLLGVFDVLVVVLFGVGFVAVVIKSFRLKVHPAYGIIGLIGLPIIVYLTAFGANTLDYITQISFLGNALNHFNLSILFFHHSVLIVTGSAVLVLLVMVGGGLFARR